MASLIPKGVKPTFQPRITRLYSRWMDSCYVQQCIIKIQTWWIHTMKVKIQLQPKNTHDYITLEPVESPIFLHVSDLGMVTAFSAEILANYFESSGDFKHPESRVEFTVPEIRRLDKQTAYKYNLSQNYDTIISRHRQERAQVQLEEFLLNDFETQYQHVLACCHSQTSAEDWETEMSTLLSLFSTSFVSLCQVNFNLCVERLQVHLMELSVVTVLPNLSITSYLRQLVFKRYIIHILGN
jgi:hypothetical protein